MPSEDNSLQLTIPSLEYGSEGTVPLVKWPGGKRNLLKHLLPLLPRQFNRYFEPFAGGAALYFSALPQQATLSDSNDDLINCYRCVRDHAGAVVNALAGMVNSEEEYYKVRASEPENAVDRAARFIYLTSLSFNGIYRLNQAGAFNVPYGKRTNSDFKNPERIYRASEVLTNVSLLSCDFEIATSTATEGDLVYFDPPYTVAHSNNGFVKYNAKIFSWQDQERLSKLASSLVDKGCHVIVSNADHPSIHDLYSNLKCHVLERSSIIAASSKGRRQITECIFYSESSAS